MEEVISVIIPVFNKEKIIEECVDSVKNQTYEKLEIILVDDGSVDNSYEILNQIASQDERIKVAHQNNKGPGAARNYGIQIATGDYLMFIDADDTIENDAIERLIEAKDCDITICGYIEIGIDNNIVEKTYGENREYTTKEFLNVIGGWKDDPLIGAPWNKLYNARLIKDNNILFPIDQTWGEDFCFNINAYRHARNIRVISSCLYRYKRADGSLSKTNHIKYGKELKKFWNIRYDAYKRLKELFIELGANTDQLILIKELELKYIYGVMHLGAVNKGFGQLIELIEDMRQDSDLSCGEFNGYRRRFNKLAYIRAVLFCCVNSRMLGLFEKIFYTGVRVIRAVRG